MDLPDLEIEVMHMGTKYSLHTVEEEMRRSRNGQELIGGTGEERYVVPNGSKLTFSRRSAHIATVFAPVPPPPRNEGYAPATFTL